MGSLSIVLEDARDTGQCDCCGNYSRVVWGFAEDGESVVAAYFVHWTLGSVRKHGANFDILVGGWGEAGDASDRTAVSLEYRLGEAGPFFTVIDAAGRNAAELCGRALSRDQVVGYPIAAIVFEVADAILLQDKRVAELLRS